ncbi:MAG TPA: hypothetical protein PKL57_00810 [Candidatus Wallbacteria bacterium]|nr:hypothetical protein [Candidatus Wallbacteria bacterium]
MNNSALTKILKLSLMAFCAWYISAFAYIALSRAGYAFELEWMEGSMADHIRILSCAGNIYAAPSLDFVPFIYAPLYYAICYPAALLSGNALFAMRLVSLLSFGLTLFLIYKWVFKETGVAAYSFYFVALFTACFEVCGAWYDIARVDSLALLLIMSFFYILRFGRFKYNQVIAALMLTLACMCKQSNIVAAAPLIIFLAFQDFKKHIPLISISALSLVCAVFYLNYRSDYLFGYYAYYLPSMHAIDKSLIAGFWFGDLLPKIPFLIILSAFFLIKLYFIKSADFLFYSSLAFGMVLSSWLARIHEGGYLNVLMPACAVFSLLAVTALKYMSGSFSFKLNFNNANTAEAKSDSAGHNILPFVYAVLAAQFLLLLYNPALYIPSDDDLAAGRRLVDKIKSFKGEVYVPYHPYLVLAAGKSGPAAHHMAVFDILRADKDGINYKLINEAVSGYIESKKAEAIILDNLNFTHIELVKKFYSLKSLIFEGGVFYPVCGMRTRPQYLFVRK